MVHINRLKPAHGYHVKNVSPRPPRKHKARRDSVSSRSSSEELSAIKIGALPLATYVPRQDNEPPNQATPYRDSSPLSPIRTPVSAERQDPSYEPADSPRSRRELRSTREDLPLTTSTTKSNRHDNENNEASHLNMLRIYFTFTLGKQKSNPV